MAKKPFEEAALIDTFEAQRKQDNRSKIQRVLKVMVEEGTLSVTDGKKFIAITGEQINQRREDGKNLFGTMETVSQTLNPNPVKRNSFTYKRTRKGLRETPDSCSCELGEFRKFCADYGVELPPGWPEQTAQGEAKPRAARRPRTSGPGDGAAR